MLVQQLSGIYICKLKSGRGEGKGKEGRLILKVYIFLMTESFSTQYRWNLVSPFISVVDNEIQI